VSTATFDYAYPRIVSVAPASAVTYIDPRRPVVVTVSGYDFGLLDPTADTLVAFGNADDGTFTTAVTIVSRYPSPQAVAVGAFVPPTGDFLETITFTLPETLGANRSVRVVPYRRGQAVPTRDEVLAIPIQGTADVFSFLPPTIKSVFVGPVVAAADVARVRSLFGVVDTTTFRRLEIYAKDGAEDGRSFGPPQRTDTVQVSGRAP